MVLKRSDQAAFWQKHITNFRASGLSRDAYCREHGLKRHQLGYQLDKRSKKTAVGGESVFARVVTAEPLVAGRPAARLVFSGGITLELDSGTDPAWIARLVAHVGGQQ